MVDVSTTAATAVVNKQGIFKALVLDVARGVKTGNRQEIRWSYVLEGRSALTNSCAQGFREPSDAIAELQRIAPCAPHERRAHEKLTPRSCFIGLILPEHPFFL
jgi:hypothetical protein